MYICCPSIHYYNNQQSAGEIVINHSPVVGGNNLSVCIPFVSSSDTTPASNLITNIIETVSTSAPAEGESVTLNINEFTLQTIVPNKPFFTYTSTSDSTDWIVFNTPYAIPLSSTTLTTLGQIIQPYTLATPGGPLFINSKGPNNTGSIGDGIYISCQPTGSSTEETEVKYTKNTTSYDILSNPTAILIIEILIGCIIFVILFMTLNYIYTYFTSDSPKLPSIPGITKT
jgi:hypothetical protein